MNRNGSGMRTRLAAAVAGTWAVLASWTVWGMEGEIRPRVAFDRPGGFTVSQGEEARVTATLVGGSGGMWFSWEGNNGGTATGDGNATFAIDTSMPGEYWLRAVGGSDGTDGDYSGKIRFRVAGKGAAAKGSRAAGDGETLVWSEDFSSLSGNSTLSSYSGTSGTWTLFKGFNCSNDWLRLGTSSTNGYAISPSASLDGSVGRLEFGLALYGTDSTTVTLQRSTDGGTSWSDLATYSGFTKAMTTNSVDVPASASVMFKWSSDDKNRRFYLDNVSLYATGGGGGTVESNQPPRLDLDPDVSEATVFVGKEFDLEVLATEFDGDEITLSASGLPTEAVWVAGDPATNNVLGLLEWIPTTTGTWNAVFSATDKDGTTNRPVVFTAVPEGPGSLTFESSGVNVRESSGLVSLTVIRTNGAAGAVGVSWATANGTASAGSEYTAGSGTLSFADGKTSQTLTVALIDDTASEENKTFTVTLGNPTGGAALGEIATCTVTIVDDDDANANYYASCYNNGVLKTGDTLKDALCKIINTNVKTNGYGSNLNTILNVIDACPTNSSLVQCIYLQRGLSRSSYNKEHIWAQSHGIDEKDPGYSDLHHIRACNSTMNSTRGDKDFDNCQGKSGASTNNGCYYTSSAWEPPTSAKGDVARALLYMDVRYENKYNSKYDLELVNSVGTSTSGNTLGKLSTLLAWHELDPVDDFERQRNELIYTTYQYNRNPFIDHPTWVKAVFDPSNFTPENITWTVNVTVSGNGWVNNYDSAFTAQVTNGTTKTFYSVPDTATYHHIGSISWNGELVPQAYYTNAAYYNYTTPAVTNNATLAVVFDPDLAALGTPLWWLEQYGGDAPSVTGGNWDAAELEDWNDDGVANWQEYANGTNPTALNLRQVTNVTVTAASSSGFTVGWDAVDYADGYRVRVCSTAVVDAASAGFESGNLDDGWSTNTIGTVVATNAALDGLYGLSFGTNGAWLCSTAVTNPAAVEFKYKRSSTTAAWTLVVEVSADGTKWTEAGTVTNATTSVKTATVDLSDWYGQTVFVRLRDARESGSAARYVDAVTVRTGGATVAEGTPTGTSWTATGLSAGTGYDVRVRGETTTLEETVGPWSAAVRATTATDDSGRTEQAITFPAIADQIATATVQLSATASSRLAVAYTLDSGPAVLDGTSLTFTGAGTVSITASQAGNEEFAPAVSVTRTFTVSKAPQNITFGEIADQVETATVQLSATASSGLAVSFAVTSGPAVLDGTTLNFTGTGTVTVTASQAGNALWAAAADVAQSFAVTEVQLDAPASAWASATNDTSFTAAWSEVTGAEGYELSVWTGGDAQTVAATNVTTLFSTNFDSITGNGNTTLNNGFIEGWTVTKAYAGTNEVRVGASSALGWVKSATVGATGTVKVVTRARAWTDDATVLWVGVTGCDSQMNTLSNDSVGFTNVFENIEGAVTVCWSNATASKQRFFLEEVSATEIRVVEESGSGTEPVPGYEARAVVGTSCVVTGLTAATTYEFHARATAGSSAGAWSETATVTTLSQGGEGLAQSITFGAIADQVVGATVALDATASSGLAVTYSVSGPVTLEGTTLTCTGAGTVTVTASQSGNGVWTAATDVTQTFEVSKKTQGITFGAIADQIVGASVTLGATASSGLAVTYSVSGPATLDGTTLTCTGVGTVTVTASQSGDNEWLAAANVVQSFAVTAVPAELAAPANVWASSTSETTFTAAWSAVAEAEGYQLMVWTGDGGESVATTNETVLLEEDFGDFSGNGQSKFTNGVIAGWTATNTYIQTNELRVGTTSAAGFLGAPVTATGDGTVRVVTTGRSWGRDSSVWMVVTAGGLVQSNAMTTNSATYTNDFDGLQGAVTVSWSSVASSKRFLVESVQVSEVVVSETIGGTTEFVPGYEARAVEGTTCVVTGLTASTEYTFKVRAVVDGESSAWSADATVTTLAAKQSQTITFGTIANQTVGDTVTLAATADSGLTVAYSVTGPATLSGNVLTCTGVGNVTVTASQAGNEQYAAAEDVSQSFTVVKRSQTIIFSAIGNQVATNTVTLSATATSGLDVTFAVTSRPASLNGATLTFTGAGDVTVTATQAGNDTYAPATASQTFTVSKATQSITFDAISGQSVNDTVTLNATADSGLAVSYTVSGPATIAGNVVTCTGAGTVTVTANQGGNALFEGATPVERSFEVSRVAQSIAFEAIGNQVATNVVTLSAMANSGLDVTFAVVSGPAKVNGTTLTFTGAGEVTVTATQAGDATYASATESQTFTVAKAAQDIDFPAIVGQSVGDMVTLDATASSGLDVRYTVSGPASLTGDTLTCTGAGTVTVTASQNGNDLYEAAPSVTQTFEVSLVAQTVEFTAVGNQVATNTVTLSATADSGLEVTFAVTSGPAEVEGTTLTFTGAGEVTVTATQAGNATYASATASQTFMVSKASQIIDFPAIAGQSVGATATLGATASSGLAVSYTVSGPATIAGNVVTCTGAGIVTVTATQGGNALYAAADAVVQTFAVTEAKTPEETAYAAWLEEKWNLSEETEGLGYAGAATEDYDGDKASNWKEYLADTNPDNSNDFFSVTATMTNAPNGTGWIVTLDSDSFSTNRSYTLLVYTNLNAAPAETTIGRWDYETTVTNILSDTGFLRVKVTLPGE